MNLPASNATVLYDVPAPAKLNLFLHVVGQRSDGYHLLQTVFTFIDLFDYLSYEVRSDGKIERVGDVLQGLIEQDDLVIKAARLLQKATGTKLGVQISYVKNIPAGGGLGGGSSNAATTLIALNHLWATNLSRAKLIELGRQLGADVPIFLYGRSAFAQGIGDEFQALELNPAHYVVIQPDTFIDTKLIFSNSSLTKNENPVTITDFTDWQRLQLNNTDKQYFGCNNLEPVAINVNSILSKAHKLFNNLEINARMTGSGACFFVAVATAQQARMLQQKISCKIATRSSDRSRVVRQTWVCSGLNQHPLVHWINS